MGVLDGEGGLREGGAQQNPVEERHPRLAVLAAAQLNSSSVKKKKQLIVKLLEGKECVRQGFYLPAATHSSQTSKLVVVMEQPGSSHISTRSLL